MRCAQWLDWLFINVDGKAPPIEDFLAPIMSRFADVNFADLDHYLTIDMGMVDANWKICIENTLEPYHVPVAHRETAAGQPLQIGRAARRERG